MTFVSACCWGCCSQLVSESPAGVSEERTAILSTGCISFEHRTYCLRQNFSIVVRLRVIVVGVCVMLLWACVTCRSTNWMRFIITYAVWLPAIQSLQHVRVWPLYLKRPTRRYVTILRTVPRLLNLYVTRRHRCSVMRVCVAGGGGAREEKEGEQGERRTS
jgi:hypothetical protein